MNNSKIPIITDEGGIDFRALFYLIWNDRKPIIQITVVITIIGVFYALQATPLYKSTITMYPAGEDRGGQLSQLQGMASTFGFDVGGGEPSIHIPDIVNSWRLKTKLINHRWNTDNFDIPVNLIHYWEIDDTPSISLNPVVWIKALFASDEKPDKTLIWEDVALQIINDRISVNENKYTGLITVSTLMEEPEMAAEMANFLYSAIVDFTTEIHGKQARLNREFIEDRQTDVKVQLTKAEEVLKEFRERNRSIIESPHLQLELERFIRDVEIQTQIYITLKQQYELARIEEVKETPSVVILDDAKPAVKKDRPNRKLILFYSIFLGSIIGVITILIYRIIKPKENIHH